MSLEHIAESIPELIVKSTRLVRIGQESERARLLPHFAAIFSAYKQTADMPDAKIPTLLTAAIVSAELAISKLGAPSHPRSV